MSLQYSSIKSYTIHEIISMEGEFTLEDVCKAVKTALEKEGREFTCIEEQDVLAVFQHLRWSQVIRKVGEDKFVLSGNAS